MTRKKSSGGETELTCGGVSTENFTVEDSGLGTSAKLGDVARVLNLNLSLYSWIGLNGTREKKGEGGGEKRRKGKKSENFKKQIPRRSASSEIFREWAGARGGSQETQRVLKTRSWVACGGNSPPARRKGPTSLYEAVGAMRCFVVGVGGGSRFPRGRCSRGLHHLRRDGASRRRWLDFRWSLYAVER